MKRINKKLTLNKEIISDLDSTKGGAQVGPSIYPDCPDTNFKSCYILKCADIPTIGHDDGPKCVSKTDFLCWCGGV
jgi:hypothetical protein